ncbi:MAG: hypothetical protein WA789_06045 [Candidatus Acidiferrum sp.]
MLVLARFRRAFLFVIYLALLSQIGCKKAPPLLRAETSRVAGPIRVVIWTNHAEYSLRDTVKLDVALQNVSDSTVYVDRRMFWTGLSGGLKLVIGDEQGKHLPAQLLSDAMMPPPKEGDKSILIPLHEGFSYGRWVVFPVKDFLPKPGRYSLRVIYNSMLPRELVAPELRDLPALWFGTPSIPSEPVWIQVVQ